jgi:hypothetical protein
MHKVCLTPGSFSALRTPEKSASHSRSSYRLILRTLNQSKSLLSLGRELCIRRLTGAGCVQITARQVLPELARGFGVRQSDGSVCVLLPAGFPIVINTFRKADFLVVDMEAHEAIFDLGLVNCAPGSIATT